MRRLYDFLPSGNCYKLRLLMSQLQLPYERIDVNILAGETQTEAFLASNAKQQRSPRKHWHY